MSLLAKLIDSDVISLFSRKKGKRDSDTDFHKHKLFFRLPLFAVDIFYQSFVVMICCAVVTIVSAAIMLIANFFEIEGRYK